MRVVIFVNGQFDDPEHARHLLRSDDYIIAVNGGTRHALSIGAIPRVVIGDLDSLTPELKAALRHASTQFLRFPARKDETDLELALRHAVERGASEILLIGALGGRLDQTLGNLLLLALPCLRGIDVKIVAGRQTAFLIHDQATIHGMPGDTISLLPIGGDAVGVTNGGFEWPLRNDTLPLGTTRGLSNVLLGDSGTIRVQCGMLFCVVIHQ